MSSLLITQAHLLDPVAGDLSDASWREVADGQIAATGTGPAPASGQDTRVIDAAGATVMPGLIDAHVHVLLTTFNAYEAQDWTAGHATVRALAEAERMLRRGFTTVRDVGGADWGMARAIDAAHAGAQGTVDSPRVVGVHRHIAVVIVGFFYRRAHFVIAVLHGGHLIERGGSAAGEKHLQMCRALAEFVTGRVAYRIHAVGDSGEIRSYLAAGLLIIRPGTMIAVTVGLRQCFAAINQPWARGQALFGNPLDDISALTKPQTRLRDVIRGGQPLAIAVN